MDRRPSGARAPDNRSERLACSQPTPAADDAEAFRRKLVAAVFAAAV